MSSGYQAAYLTNFVLAAVLVIVWGLATFSLTRLAHFKTRRSLQLGSWLSFGLLGVIGLLTGWRIFNLAQLAANGLELIPVNSLYSLPLAITPLLICFGLTIPMLSRLLRKGNLDYLPKSRLIVAGQIGVIAAFLTGLVMLATPSLLLGLAANVATLLWGSWRWQKYRVTPEASRDAQPGFKKLKQAGLIVLLGLFSVAGWFIVMQQTSLLPAKYNMGAVGQPAANHMHTIKSMEKSVSVTDLVETEQGTPDQRFTLVAQKSTVRLDSGRTVDGWLFNGQLPGPALRVHKGELIEVTLENRDIEKGVTIHWHGLTIPNGVDGVAGLTQNAVMPGQLYIYRFRVQDEAGTYWYHSHQASSEQVRHGLYGAFIVEPATAATNEKILTVSAHNWQTTTGEAIAFNSNDSLARENITPGTKVRIQVINTMDKTLSFGLKGVSFQVAAIDGIALNQPGQLEEQRLKLASGGRYDLSFTMPEQPVVLYTANVVLQLGQVGQAASPIDNLRELPEFDPTNYGKPTATDFGPASHFDQEYTQFLENGLGFYNGTLASIWLINGQVFPNTPSIMVREGELLKITFVNRTAQDHPMHLHGHKMLVLKRNHKSVTGSPWWADTLNVAPGEVFEVALKADNPGLWMEHCHNLEHAAEGMMTHIMYEGITSPFEAGRETINNPE